MSSVILINPFKVPAGQEEQTLGQWERVAEYMRQAAFFSPFSAFLHWRRSH